MLRGLKIKFARTLKLTLPVAPILEPEKVSVVLGAKEVRRLEECVSYHTSVSPGSGIFEQA